MGEWIGSKQLGEGCIYIKNKVVLPKNNSFFVTKVQHLFIQLFLMTSYQKSENYDVMFIFLFVSSIQKQQRQIKKFLIQKIKAYKKVLLGDQPQIILNYNDLLKGRGYLQMMRYDCRNYICTNFSKFKNINYIIQKHQLNLRYQKR